MEIFLTWHWGWPSTPASARSRCCPEVEAAMADPRSPKSPRKGKVVSLRVSFLKDTVHAFQIPVSTCIISHFFGLYFKYFYSLFYSLTGHFLQATQSQSVSLHPEALVCSKCQMLWITQSVMKMSSWCSSWCWLAVDFHMNQSHEL